MAVRRRVRRTIMPVPALQAGWRKPSASRSSKRTNKASRIRRLSRSPGALVRSHLAPIGRMPNPRAASKLDIGVEPTRINRDGEKRT